MADVLVSYTYYRHNEQQNRIGEKLYRGSVKPHSIVGMSKCSINLFRKL